MEEVHAAPAPPATGGSTAPRRKILVRRPKKARDAPMQTAEAEGVKSLPAHTTGPGSDVETLRSVGAMTRGSTPASSTAGAPTLVPTLKTTKRIDFDALRGGRETSGPGASTGRATPTSTKFGVATAAPPRTPPKPKPASEEAVAPNGPKVSGKTGKRDEWAVLGDVGEYEYMLARKMAEERAKLPPSPEALPDLPSHIADASARLKGGAFDDHYKRAYRVLAERRAEFADAAATLRDGLDAAIAEETVEDRRKVHTGWQLHVKMGEVSHGNALAKWEAQKREWERIKRERAIAFDKRPGDLVMERCDEHRRKLEILGHLDMAVPISEREGGEPWLWKMSLRDNWTRWVNVGNEFSGLYYVRDEMAYVDVEQIRRPQLHGSVERDGASDSVTRGRSVLDSKFMDVRRRKLRRRVHDILPGENGEDIDATGLEIVGEGAVNALDRLASKRITLEELEEQIASDSLETWAEIQKYRSDVATAEANRAARELAAAQAEEAAREAAMGPHLHLESDRVMAQMRWGENTAHATTTMRNTGTTAIWYKWSQVPPKAAELPHASNAGPSTFFMEESTGSLLPGESRVAMWTFKSEKPGVYIDKWILETTPNVRAGRIEPITVRGVYHADDPNSYPRRMLAAEIAHREMRTKVTAAMAKVFDRVKTPDVSKRVATKMSPVPISGPAPALWNAGNAGRRPRVYYHEESFEAFMDVRRRCIAAEKTLPPEPKEEEEDGGEEGGGAEEAGEDAEGAEEAADAAEDEPVVELPFEGWDGSVAQVEECIRNLEAAIERKAALDAAAEAAAAEGGGEETAAADAAEDAEAADAAEVADEDAEAGPPPEEVLASCRASFAEAMRVAILPRSRADLLAAALSEAVTNRLGSVDETFEKARAKYRPPSPPPPEPELDEEGNPIAPPAGEEGEAQEPGAGEEPGAGGGEKKDKDAFDSVWRRKCRKVLTRSIGEMLGAAAEAFERESVAEAEAEVNAELIRRVRDMRVTAAKLETLGEEDGEGDRGSETQPAADLGGEPQSPGRAEWTEYELLRRRKALLGREVDPSGASRAPTPGSRSRTPA